MNNVKLSSLQIGILTFLITQSFIFPITSSILFRCVKEDFWISLIIGFLIGLFFIFVFLKIQNLLKDKTIFEYNKKRFKTFGNILNLFLVLIVIFIIIIIFYKISVFINVNYLNEMPIFLICISLLIICIYAVYKGIETICRTSQILFIISIIIFITFFSLSIYYMDFNNIKPILNNNIIDITSSSFCYTLTSIIPLILLMVIPKNNVKNIKNYNKSILWGYILSFLMTFLVMMMNLLVLGNHLITIFDYPIYISLKQIEYFHFVDHLENIFSIIWIFNSFILISLGINFINIYRKNFLISKN